jgi:hypothetical protein
MMWGRFNRHKDRPQRLGKICSGWNAQEKIHPHAPADASIYLGRLGRWR